MNSFEQFFISCGFGWQLSKFLPFLVFAMIGIGLWFFLRKMIKRKWLKVTFLLALLTIPSVFYILAYPIYESDLFDNHRTIKRYLSSKEMDKTLVVVAIPECPYCIESVALMDEFKKRNPRIRVLYLVIDATVQNLKSYRKLSKSGIEFQQVDFENRSQMIEMVNSTFPSYIVSTKDKFNIWSNNDFGAAAMDAWEEAFNTK